MDKYKSYAVSIKLSNSRDWYWSSWIDHRCRSLPIWTASAGTGWIGGAGHIGLVNLVVQITRLCSVRFPTTTRGYIDGGKVGWGLRNWLGQSESGRLQGQGTCQVVCRVTLSALPPRPAVMEPPVFFALWKRMGPVTLTRFFLMFIITWEGFLHSKLVLQIHEMSLTLIWKCLRNLVILKILPLFWQKY